MLGNFWIELIPESGFDSRKLWQELAAAIPNVSLTESKKVWVHGNLDKDEQDEVLRICTKYGKIKLLKSELKHH